MGCDIHSVAERRADGKWEAIKGFAPFDWRSYGMFGFLANVRNYSAIPCISEPRGLPDDSPFSEDHSDCDYHSGSWLSVDELSAFDYEQEIEDRRVTRQVAPNMWSGAVTAEPGEGAKTTFREFLGEGFFDDLQKLKDIGAERIVFCFDN